MPRDWCVTIGGAQAPQSPVAVIACCSFFSATGCLRYATKWMHSGYGAMDRNERGIIT